MYVFNISKSYKLLDPWITSDNRTRTRQQISSWRSVIFYDFWLPNYKHAKKTHFFRVKSASEIILPQELLGSSFNWNSKIFDASKCGTVEKFSTIYTSHALKKLCLRLFFILARNRFHQFAAFFLKKNHNIQLKANQHSKSTDRANKQKWFNAATKRHTKETAMRFRFGTQKNVNRTLSTDRKCHIIRVLLRKTTILI